MHLCYEYNTSRVLHNSASFVAVWNVSDELHSSAQSYIHFLITYLAVIIVSWVSSAHGCLNITHNFGPHWRLPGIWIAVWKLLHWPLKFDTWALSGACLRHSSIVTRVYEGVWSCYLIGNEPVKYRICSNISPDFYFLPCSGDPASKQDRPLFGTGIYKIAASNNNHKY